MVNDWAGIGRFVAETERRNKARMAKPARIVRYPVSPRCHLCGEFLSVRPTRFQDGRAAHRECLGDTPL